MVWERALAPLAHTPRSQDTEPRFEPRPGGAQEQSQMQGRGSATATELRDVRSSARPACQANLVPKVRGSICPEEVALPL